MFREISKIEVDYTDYPIKIYIDGERLDLSSTTRLDISLSVELNTVSIDKTEQYILKPTNKQLAANLKQLKADKSASAGR